MRFLLLVFLIACEVFPQFFFSHPSLKCLQFLIILIWTVWWLSKTEEVVSVSALRRNSLTKSGVKDKISKCSWIYMKSKKKHWKETRSFFTGLNLTVVQVYAVQYNKHYTNKDSAGLRNFQTWRNPRLAVRICYLTTKNTELSIVFKVYSLIFAVSWNFDMQVSNS